MKTWNLFPNACSLGSASSANAKRINRVTAIFPIHFLSRCWILFQISDDPMPRWICSQFVILFPCNNAKVERTECYQNVAFIFFPAVRVHDSVRHDDRGEYWQQWTVQRSRHQYEHPSVSGKFSIHRQDITSHEYMSLRLTCACDTISFSFYAFHLPIFWISSTSFVYRLLLERIKAISAAVILACIYGSLTKLVTWPLHEIIFTKKL